MVVLVGALLIWFAPRPYAAMKTALQQRPLPSAGWGIVAILGFVVLLIVVLIAMILLAIVFGLLGFSDLIGIDILGGIVAILGASLAFAVVAGYVADALVGVALAGLVMRGENPSRWRELAVLAVGAAVVVLLSSLPVVGPWVKLVVILLGLGAVLLTAGGGPRRPDPVVAAGRIRPASAGAADTRRREPGPARRPTRSSTGPGTSGGTGTWSKRSCARAATTSSRWTCRSRTTPPGCRTTRTPWSRRSGSGRNLIVVAQSFGGYIAPIVCDRGPAKLLVLVAAMVPSPGETAEEMFANTGWQAETAEVIRASSRLLPRCAIGAGHRGARREDASSRSAWQRALATRRVAECPDAIHALSQRPLLPADLGAPSGPGPAAGRRPTKSRAATVRF